MPRATGNLPSSDFLLFLLKTPSFTHFCYYILPLPYHLYLLKTTISLFSEKLEVDMF